MFQREFALRLVATPGSSLWSRLSANVQLYVKVDHIMKVGKNNFRPPPQVESSVVRIVPTDPPPPVKFEEFDGLNRILFSRRNKTANACFLAKGVMEMLESNWKTWCSERNQVRWLSSRTSHLVSHCTCQTITDKVDIKAMVEGVLEETEFKQQRAAKMSVDDLLKYASIHRTSGFVVI